MKIGFKRILLLSIIIICGVSYILGGEFSILENKNIKETNVEAHSTNDTNIKTVLVLVNKKCGLNKNYVPEELSMPNIPFSNKSDEEEKYVSRIIVKPLERLVNTAKNEGVILLGNSGYRSYNSQKSTYDNRVKSQGKKLADAYVAKPGYSEHQTGLCIDITNKDNYFVEGTKEANWLAKNCYRFGFIIRYPKEKKNITNIEYEPWHIRYVGEAAAKYIHDNKITLEEYLSK